MAAEQLFGNTLIVEGIFLSLPLRDLLLVQRVCRQWRDAISNTKALQAALFFRPDALDHATNPSPAIIAEPNPLLQSRFPGVFDGNRYLSNNLGPWKTFAWVCGDSGESIESNADEHARLMEAYARPEASWRRMIPCKPAPLELQIVTGGDRRDRVDGGVLMTLRFPQQSRTPRYDMWLLGEGAGQAGGLRAMALNRLPWLTFGVMYDVLEEMWFRGPERIDIMAVDCALDYGLDSGIAKRLGYYQFRLEGGFGPRVVTTEQIGGVGRVLVHMYKNDWNRRGPPPANPHREGFESKGTTVRELKWEREVCFSERRETSGFD